MRKLQGYGILVISLFAAFILIIAPIEIREVKNAKDYSRINAIYTGYEIKRSSFNKASSYLELHFYDFKNRKQISVIDQRPGDFPFSIGFMGKNILDTNINTQKKLKIGQKYELINNVKGHKYYLDGGDGKIMWGLIIICIGWFFALLYLTYIQKKREETAQYQGF